jgi:hypothetical protein
MRQLMCDIVAEVMQAAAGNYAGVPERAGPTAGESSL